MRTEIEAILKLMSDYVGYTVTEENVGYLNEIAIDIEDGEMIGLCQEYYEIAKKSDII